MGTRPKLQQDRGRRRVGSAGRRTERKSCPGCCSAMCRCGPYRTCRGGEGSEAGRQDPQVGPGAAGNCVRSREMFVCLTLFDTRSL